MWWRDCAALLQTPSGRNDGTAVACSTRPCQRLGRALHDLPENNHCHRGSSITETPGAFAAAADDGGWQLCEVAVTAPPETVTHEPMFAVWRQDLLHLGVVFVAVLVTAVAVVNAVGRLAKEFAVAAVISAAVYTQWHRWCAAVASSSIPSPEPALVPTSSSANSNSRDAGAIGEHRKAPHQCGAAELSSVDWVHRVKTDHSLHDGRSVFSICYEEQEAPLEASAEGEATNAVASKPQALQRVDVVLMRLLWPHEEAFDASDGRQRRRFSFAGLRAACPIGADIPKEDLEF